jgi:arylsulfatase A-like enzyme
MRPAPPARSTAGRWAAATTGSTASWTPRPTSTRPSWCVTTRPSRRRAPFESGYHLTADLVDQSIRYLADHQADQPGRPWHLWLALGACHAPHQAPDALIRQHDAQFATAGTWSANAAWRGRRRWASCRRTPNCRRATTASSPGPSTRPSEQRCSRGCRRPMPAMLDHADQQLAGCSRHLDASGQLDDTMVLLLSDNGASQEGGPLGFVNAMGPYNQVPEPPPKSSPASTTSAGPTPTATSRWGWAMAANTPLKRYKQNTHGGGIRDPLVMSWPAGLAARGELRHGFAHASDVVPTLLDLLGLQPPQGSTAWQMPPLRRRELRAAAARPGRPAAPSRSISRCSATAACGRTAGRRWPSTRRAAVRRRCVGAVPPGRRLSENQRSGRRPSPSGWRR